MKVTPAATSVLGIGKEFEQHQQHGFGGNRDLVRLLWDCLLVALLHAALRLRPCSLVLLGVNAARPMRRHAAWTPQSGFAMVTTLRRGSPPSWMQVRAAPCGHRAPPGRAIHPQPAPANMISSRKLNPPSHPESSVGVLAMGGKRCVLPCRHVRGRRGVLSVSWRAACGCCHRLRATLASLLRRCTWCSPGASATSCPA